MNPIVEYIVHNTLMKDLFVLQESTLPDQSSVVEVFNERNVRIGIHRMIFFSLPQYFISNSVQRQMDTLFNFDNVVLYFRCASSSISSAIHRGFG